MNMMNTTWSAPRGVAVALALVVATGMAGCSDDAKADPTTTIAETTAKYGERIDEECPGGDPGFDAFHAEHQTPTAADWAAFLPAPLKMLSELRDCIAESHPPAVVEDAVDLVVAAFDVVVADFEQALTAAQSGDLDTANEWITQMHDIDQPKIEEAISQVGVG